MIMNKGWCFTCFCTPPPVPPLVAFIGVTTMLMNPHISQQHASLQHTVWRPQQEATRPKARFKPTNFAQFMCHQLVIDHLVKHLPRSIRWILCYFKTFLFVFGLMAADLIATGTMKHIKKPLKSGEIILQCSPVTTSLTESVLSSVTRCWKINVAQKIDTTVFT